MAFTAGRVPPMAIADDDVTPPPPTPPPAPMNGSGSSSSAAGSSSSSNKQKRRSLVARGKEIALAAWQVSKIFSPPVQHPVLRLFCLWVIATRILLTFVLTLMASGIAQLFPPLGAPLITLVTTLLVPKDAFSKPYVDIIIEGARSA